MLPPDLRAGLNIGLTFNQEPQQTLDPILSVQQDYYLRRSSVFLNSDPGNKPFIEAIRKEMISFPNDVVLVSVVGESGGNSKTSTAGELLAKLTLSKQFRNQLLKGTGKEPMGHYITMPIVARNLREGPNPKITSPHPYWNDGEVLSIQDEMFMNIVMGVKRLPLIDPGKSHVIIAEYVTHLMGDSIYIDPHTFVMFRKTNPQGQEVAANIRGSFDPEDPDEPDNRFDNNNVEPDKRGLGKEDYAWSMGTPASAEMGRRVVNSKLCENKPKLIGRGIPDFDISDLAQNPGFRNDVVLTEFYWLKLDEWKVYPGQGRVSENPWQGGKKYLFFDLLHSNELDVRRLQLFGG